MTVAPSPRSPVIAWLSRRSVTRRLRRWAPRWSSEPRSTFARRAGQRRGSAPCRGWGKDAGSPPSSSSMSAEVPGWSVAIDRRRRSQVREHGDLDATTGRATGRVADGRRGPARRTRRVAVRLGLRDLGAEVAERGLPQLELPRRRRLLGLPRRDRRHERKILRLNAAKLYGIEVPRELQLPAEEGTPAAREDAQLVESG